MERFGSTDSKAPDPEGLIVKNRPTVRQLAIRITVGIGTVCFRLAAFLLADHPITAAGDFTVGQTVVCLIPVAIITGFFPLDQAIAAARG
tara:strand:+ start:551 stop:820 length:270 start_codon:yes stop_codon:yes gene_type:complete